MKLQMTPHQIYRTIEAERPKRCRREEDSSHDEIPSIIFVMPKNSLTMNIDDASTVVTYDSDDEFLQEISESSQQALTERLKLYDDMNDVILALLALATEFVAANSAESEDDESTAQDITVHPVRKKTRTQ